VPLTDNLLIIDYIKKQNYPVILVSSSKLGSINHTLLSIESCNVHKLNLYALIYNRLPGSDTIIADDNLIVIKRVLNETFPRAMVAEISHEDKYEGLSDLFTAEGMK
jgi:dethiobiotin synthetase